jgi:hypothetical protein
MEHYLGASGNIQETLRDGVFREHSGNIEVIHGTFMEQY